MRHVTLVSKRVVKVFQRPYNFMFSLLLSCFYNILILLLAEICSKNHCCPCLKVIYNILIFDYRIMKRYKRINIADP